MDAQTTQLLDVVLKTVKGIIAATGLIYGGWQFFEGYTDDQPEKKKKAITVILVAAGTFALLTAAKPIIIGFTN